MASFPLFDNTCRQCKVDQIVWLDNYPEGQPGLCGTCWKNMIYGRIVRAGRLYQGRYREISPRIERVRRHHPEDVARIQSLEEKLQKISRLMRALTDALCALNTMEHDPDSSLEEYTQVYFQCFKPTEW
jgi:protein-arginine kinase activator protein McsA